jgi:hypothetical protein
MELIMAPMAGVAQGMPSRLGYFNLIYIIPFGLVTA